MHARQAAILFVFVPLLSACVSAEPRRGRADISDALAARTGHELRPADARRESRLPPGVAVADGLTVDEAVAVALWNNAAYRAQLVDLGLATAQLDAAAALPNPVFSLLFPWGPKQLEATVRWPIEALWQRPKRVSIAHLNVEAVAETLVESGLNLVSEVKLAYADLLLAESESELADEAMSLHRELARLSEARLRAGDISGLELDKVQAARLQAEQRSGRAEHTIVAARDRLRSLLGLDEDASPIALQNDPVGSSRLPAATASAIPGGAAGARLQAPLPAADLLVADALAARPDVRAAELAIEAAGEKAGLAESESWRITAVLDANGAGREGFELGPGVDAVLPLFDRNQGGVTQAEAELEQAAQRYAALRSLIVLGVREARTEYASAAGALGVWSGQIVPALQEAAQRTERAEQAGQVSHLDVVRARLELVQARIEEARVAAELLRARARLEKAVGKNLPAATMVSERER